MFKKFSVSNSLLRKKGSKFYFFGLGASIFSLIAPFTSVALETALEPKVFSLFSQFLSDRKSLSALLSDKRDQLVERAKRSDA